MFKQPMKQEVKNSVGVFECVATPEMAAILDGKTMHNVYSTFWLCYHAEVAARRAIEPFFDEGENAVGGELCIRHERMCALGESVRIVATVSEVCGSKIVCSIEAFSSKGRFAVGHQTQIVLLQSVIDTLCAEAYS